MKKPWIVAVDGEMVGMIAAESAEEALEMAHDLLIEGAISVVDPEEVMDKIEQGEFLWEPTPSEEVPPGTKIH